MVRWFFILPFLISCGGDTRLSAFSNDHSFGETLEKICYSDTVDSCFSLKTIDPVEFGYKDPLTVDPIQYRKPIRAIKLDEVDLSQKLSPNFKASEFLSPEKGPIGIFSASVVEHLQVIRDLLAQPLHINSGYRSPAYNEGIPGAANWSRHMYGDAADIVSAGVPLNRLKEICLEQGAWFTQLYENHVHCDWRHETLADEFFGPESIIPKDEMRTQILADLRGKTEIHIDGDVTAGREVTVTSTLEEQEDPNEKLLRQWTILHPDGRSEEFNQQEVHVTLISGTYVIIHILGGNIYLEKSFEVP